MSPGRTVGVSTPCGLADLDPLHTATAYYLPRHLAPNPTYPHLYPPYLIRGYPDTAALENRQTIINDYITSQQMHHNAAASAMAQRADMLRGLSPRESSLALNYAAGPRGGRWASPRLCGLAGVQKPLRAHWLGVWGYGTGVCACTVLSWHSGLRGLWGASLVSWAPGSSAAGQGENQSRAFRTVRLGEAGGEGTAPRTEATQAGSGPPGRGRGLPVQHSGKGS